MRKGIKGETSLMKVLYCHDCNNKISNDEIALNLKLLGKQIGVFRCSSCLSAVLGCEIELLKKMTDYYKNSGCILFQTTYTD